MILPIYAYGHPVLRKETVEIEENYKGLKSLIDNMFETMYEARGMGLAAPQIGKNIRLFIVDTAQLDEEDRDGQEGTKQVFINPEVLDTAGKIYSYEEGCLSIPDIRGKVRRKTQVRIEYFDENFELKDTIFTGLNSRVIQHEYDHVEGVLFTDLLKPLKKRMLKKRLGKVKNGQIDLDYKMIFG